MNNVFLLTNGKINFLIDTSAGRLWNKLQKKLERAGIAHNDFLILTHAHFDHAANANRIKKKYGASEDTGGLDVLPLLRSICHGNYLPLPDHFKRKITEN